MPVTHVGIVSFQPDEKDKTPAYETITLGLDDPADLKVASRLRQAFEQSGTGVEITQTSAGLNIIPGNAHLRSAEEAQFGFEPQISFAKHAANGSADPHAFTIQDCELIARVLKECGIGKVPSAKDLMNYLDKTAGNGRTFGASGHCEDWRRGMLGMTRFRPPLPE
jgi:hypothetical protein